MSEISIEELETNIADILKDADLATTSTKIVRLTLEKKFGVSLVDRKNVIDKLVMEYVDKMKDDDDDVGLSEDEEDVKPKIKVEKDINTRNSRSSNKRKNESNDDNKDLEESPNKRNRKAKDDVTKKPKRAGRGYTRVCKLSPALSELVGSDQMARHEVVKKVWSLIKENNLYDPNNKHFAVCDDQMFKVFGVKRFRAFGMMKYLKNHFVD